MSKISRNKVLLARRRRKARARRQPQSIPLHLVRVDMGSNIRSVDQVILERFLDEVIGTDFCLLTDLSHLCDFAGYDVLDGIERVFGVRLPHDNFYVWEAIRAIHEEMRHVQDREGAGRIQQEQSQA